MLLEKSLLPLINNNNASVRESALTRWRKGYSIKTKRYRLTKWGINGELGYELYDHDHDENELINLADNQDYNDVLDSLKLVIEKELLMLRLSLKALEDNLRMLDLCTRQKTLHLEICMI